MKKVLTLSFLILSSSVLTLAQTPEKLAISKTLSEFETAIVENNAKLASKLLHADAIILEGRGSETKDQYLSHHFHSDGRFLSAIERKEMSQEIKTEGNIAWVSTITSMKGTYSDREIDLTSLELAVLKKEEGNWKIIALHWSSR